MALVHVEGRRQGGATEGGLVLVLLPFLSGSAREWQAVQERLGDAVASVCMDLPGFGGSRDVPGYTVAEMAESVAETIASLGLQRFVLVGHSMAGKVSAVLARHAAKSDARLSGLAGVALIAPSPPSPEPMSDSKRHEMLEALGGEPRSGERGERRDRDAAAKYISDNIDGDVTSERYEAAVEDVLRMNRAAWRAWLESGSRENWCARVGILPLPVLVVAGDKDGSLGPDVQRTVSLPHWPNGRLASLHANHLIPIEKPAELARLLAEFAEELAGEGVRARRSMEPEEVPVPQAYIDLLLGGRVSASTRSVLEKRAEGDSPAYQPKVLTVIELAQMRAVVERVLPQRPAAPGAATIDLTARLDRQFAEAKGDGWRFADLPEDAAAAKAALETLEWFAQAERGKGWLALDAPEREELLTRVQQGKLSRGLLQRLEGIVGLGTEGEPRLSGEQMQHWFEDVRGECAKMWMVHPATLARIGYSGIADGADSAHQTGFVLIGEGEREAWEPEPTVPTAVAAGGAR